MPPSSHPLVLSIWAVCSIAALTALLLKAVWGFPGLEERVRKWIAISVVAAAVLAAAASVRALVSGYVPAALARPGGQTAASVPGVSGASSDHPRGGTPTEAAARVPETRVSSSPTPRQEPSDRRAGGDARAVPAAQPQPGHEAVPPSPPRNEGTAPPPERAGENPPASVKVPTPILPTSAVEPAPHGREAPADQKQAGMVAGLREDLQRQQKLLQSVCEKRGGARAQFMLDRRSEFTTTLWDELVRTSPRDLSPALNSYFASIRVLRGLDGEQALLDYANGACASRPDALSAVLQRALDEIQTLPGERR